MFKLFFRSDNGEEYIGLKNYLSVHGISHYTTAPHTPQQNGLSERRHRHLIETGLTLLTDAHMPLDYWPYAFQTAAYLVGVLTSSNLTILIYLIKIKHKVMWACASFKPKGLSFEGMC